MGIFLAIKPRNWESDYTKWPEPEYMTPPMIDWELAHLA